MRDKQTYQVAASNRIDLTHRISLILLGKNCNSFTPSRLV